jgi:hypothetical protein
MESVADTGFSWLFVGSMSPFRAGVEQTVGQVPGHWSAGSEEHSDADSRLYTHAQHCGQRHWHAARDVRQGEDRRLADRHCVDRRRIRHRHFRIFERVPGHPACRIRRRRLAWSITSSGCGNGSTTARRTAARLGVARNGAADPGSRALRTNHSGVSGCRICTGGLARRRRFTGRLHRSHHAGDESAAPRASAFAGGRSAAGGGLQGQQPSLRAGHRSARRAVCAESAALPSPAMNSRRRAGHPSGRFIRLRRSLPPGCFAAVHESGLGPSRRLLQRSDCAHACGCRDHRRGPRGGGAADPGGGGVVA